MDKMFHCHICDYQTDIKGNYKRHLKTKKHIKKRNMGIENIKIKPKNKIFNSIESNNNIIELLKKNDTYNNIAYEYDIKDPFIQELYNKIYDKIKLQFTISNNKITVDDVKTMTTHEIDNHNLKIVNELINIAQEQQKSLHQCLIVENMNLEPFDIKYNYYKNAVKNIIFLYGEEVSLLSNMLIEGLLLHNT